MRTIILDVLRDFDGMTVLDIAAAIDDDVDTVRHDLAALAEAGLVRERGDRWEVTP